ncbi:MAG: hypothetical protein HYZ43_00425 [Flavobacteriia bacterium]|nr:hypothetical protein [Flavobacteriia bacterium]
MVYKAGQHEVGQINYQVVFTDINYQDSLVIPVMDIDIPSCAKLNSIWFTTDSIGFMTLSGGCYMYNNQLFRTEDRGLHWKQIDISISGYNIPSMLSKKRFHMFDLQRGIIIWQVSEDKLLIGVTSDKGISWESQQCQLPFEVLEGRSEIEVVYFAPEGEVTLVLRYMDLNRSLKTAVLQTRDYGESFQLLK